MFLTNCVTSKEMDETWQKQKYENRSGIKTMAGVVAQGVMYRTAREVKDSRKYAIGRKSEAAQKILEALLFLRTLCEREIKR
jgi:hypothetical protein